MEYNWEEIFKSGIIISDEEEFELNIEDLKAYKIIYENIGENDFRLLPIQDFDYDDYLSALFVDNDKIIGIRIEEGMGKYLDKGLDLLQNIEYFRWDFDGEEANDEKIIKIPDFIKNYSNLIHLELYNIDNEDGIVLIHEMKNSYIKLKKLILNGKFHSIPDWISKLPNIRSLVWNVSNLDIPESFKELPKKCLNRNMAWKELLDKWDNLHK
jgi:hypothetical protein